jgi:hypothetical protein
MKTFSTARNVVGPENMGTSPSFVNDWQLSAQRTKRTGAASRLVIT